VTYRLTKTFAPKLDYGSIRRELDAKGIKDPTASQMRQVVIAIRRAKLPDPKVAGKCGEFLYEPDGHGKEIQKSPTLVSGNALLPPSCAFTAGGWKCSDC
jgi:hypothetical protein